MTSKGASGRRAESDDSYADQGSEHYGREKGRHDRKGRDRSRSRPRSTYRSRGRSTSRRARGAHFEPRSQSSPSDPRGRSGRSRDRRTSSRRDRRGGTRVKGRSDSRDRDRDRRRGDSSDSDGFADQVLNYFDITEALHTRAVKHGKVIPVDKNGCIVARVYETNGTTVTAVEVKDPSKLDTAKQRRTRSEERKIQPRHPQRRSGSETPPARVIPIERATKREAPVQESVIAASKRMVVNVPPKWSSVDIRIQRSKDAAGVKVVPVVGSSAPHACTCPASDPSLDARKQHNEMVTPYSPFGIEQTYSEVEYHTGVAGHGVGPYTIPTTHHSGPRNIPIASSGGRNVDIQQDCQCRDHHRIFGGRSASYMVQPSPRVSNYSMKKGNMEMTPEQLRSKTAIPCHRRPSEAPMSYRSGW